MTPILIGSAASAGPEAASARPRVVATVVAPSSERKSGVRYVDVMTFLSITFKARSAFDVAGLLFLTFAALRLL
jgi:hypothetical protein